MTVVRGVQQLAPFAAQTVVTIGNFDGVHLGHQEILRTALKEARRRGCPSIAYTFRPHPQVVLRPGVSVQLLSTYDEKVQRLQEQGIEIVIEEPFDRTFSELSPEAFFEEVVLGRLKAAAIVVGYDFAFGKARHGHLQVLQSLCQRAGVDLQVVAPFQVGDTVASSSRIRRHLLAGELEAAQRLLGRAFSYSGTVIRGDARGSQLGFPTANVRLGDQICVPLGVYASGVRVQGSAGSGQILPSVTHIGVRPTFYAQASESGVLIESHLLDRRLDLYDQRLEIQLYRSLRPEKKFRSADELKQAIAHDIEQSRHIFQSQAS